MYKEVFFDIEVYQDLLIVCFLEDGKITDFVFHKKIDEAKRKALAKYYDRDDIRLVGFNSLYYDSPMINRFLGRSVGFEIKKDIKEKIEDLADLRTTNDEIINNKQQPSPFYVWKENSYDIKQDCMVGDSLKSLAGKTGYNNLLETPIPFDIQETTAEQVTEILGYCQNDVRMTEHVFNTKKIISHFNVRNKLGDLYDYHWDGASMAKKFAALAELTIYKMMFPKVEGKPSVKTYPIAHDFSDIIDDRICFQTPELRDALQHYKGFHYHTVEGDTPALTIYLGNLRVKLGVGGIHADLRGDDLFVNKASDDTFVSQFDVSAYYPSIIEELNITPDGFPDLPSTVSELKKLRADAPTKEEGMAYKLVANSISGKFLDKHALLYSPRAYHSMTVNGQFFLLELAETFHLAGFVIPQINTDSVSVVCTEDTVGEAQSIIKKWEEKYLFTMTQDNYYGFIQSNVNNYVCANKNNEVIKTKGSIWGDYDNEGIPSRAKIITKMKVDYLLYGTPSVDTVGEVIDYMKISKASKDRTWIIKDGEDDTLNVKGVNRLYIAKQGYEIGTVNDESGKYVSNEAGEMMKLCNSNMESLSLDNIDHSAYVRKAEEDLEQVNIFQANYQSEVYFNPKEDTEEDREFNKKLRKVLKKAKVIKRGSRGMCPDVNCPGHTSDNVASLWKGKMHCFRCDKFFDLHDLSEMGYEVDEMYTKQLLDTPSESPPEAPIETKVVVTKTSVTSVPDFVWDGVLGELADIYGVRNHFTLIGLFSVLSHMFVDRGNYEFAGNETRIANYSVLVAPPGGGKQAIGSIQNAALHKLQGRRLLGNIASGQALKDSVFIPEENVTMVDGKEEKTITYRSEPTHLYIDELVGLLKTGSSDTSNTFSTLTEYYDTIIGTKDSSQTNKVYKKGDPKKEIEECLVTMFGSMTPKGFMDKFMRGHDAVSGGLLSRFHIFYVPVDDTNKFFTKSGRKSDWKNRLEDKVNTILNNGVKILPYWADMVPEEIRHHAYNKQSFTGKHQKIRAAGDLSDIETRDMAKYVRTAIVIMLANRRSVVTKNDLLTAEWIMNYHAASYEYLTDVFEQNREVVQNEYVLAEDKINQKIEDYIKQHPERTVNQIRGGLRPRGGKGDSITTKQIRTFLAENDENLKSVPIKNNEGKPMRTRGFTWFE